MFTSVRQLLFKPACKISVAVVMIRNTHGSNLKKFSKKERQHYVNNVHSIVKYAKSCFTCEINYGIVDCHDEEKTKWMDNVLHVLRTNPPQIFGFNICDVKEKVKVMSDVGLSQQDALLVTLTIPPSVIFNIENLQEVVKALLKYKIPVAKTFAANPYIGNLDSTQLNRNLILLSDYGLDMAKIMAAQPIIFCYPLSLSALSWLEKLKNVNTEDNMLVENALCYFNGFAVDKPAESLVDLINNVAESELNNPSEFLNTFGIDAKEVYKVCPEFLLTSQELLETSLNTVLASPFFFSQEDVVCLLKKRPDVFLQFHKEKHIEQVRYIESICSSKSRLYTLLSTRPEVFSDLDVFYKRCQLFRKFGFKEKDVGRLLVHYRGSQCFFDSENFSDDSLYNILNFYSASKDILPNHIILSTPTSLSLKFFPVIKSRLSYLRHTGQSFTVIRQKYKKNSHKVTLQAIANNHLEDFVAKVCKVEMKEYINVCDELKLDVL